MAPISIVNALLGDLVSSITRKPSSTNSKELKQLRDAAARTLKTQQYVRTNQFEVDAALDGLIEKFSILNRDDLADALSKRLDELQNASNSKWSPEILSLVLHLSDRPDQKSSLEALELLKPPSPPPSPITWEEILADDPLTGDIWVDESYSSSSDYELEVSEQELPSLSARHKHPDASSANDHVESQSLLVPVSRDSLTALQSAQFWKHAKRRESGAQAISELQAIREVLLMLHGLPTALFTIDKQNQLIYYSANIALSQVSLSSLNDALQTFSSVGSDLFRLRLWIQKPQNVPLLQAFNSAVAARTRDFDQRLSGIEERFANPNIPVVISLLQLHQDVSILSRPLGPLCELAASIPAQESGFICLEHLYDQTCAFQAAGDDEIYEILGRIFFDCLEIYLRPVRKWMEDGSILEGDDSFFISIADKDSAVSSLWHDRFALRAAPDGELHVPKFLHPAVKKILNAGKSIVFLRQLTRQEQPKSDSPEPKLDFDHVCRNSDLALLAPFSELLGVAFDSWIGSKYGPASAILQQRLFINCGLWQHIGALEHVYFSKGGVRFQAFADELFRRMDNRRVAWNDKFLLTELARSVFSGVGGLKVDSISVRTTSSKNIQRSVKMLSSIAIDFNLPWPIQNIVQRSSLPIYQRVFRILLQVHRAKYLLKLDSFLLRQTATQNRNRSCHLIRQQLTWFTDVLHWYITEVAIQTSSQDFRTNLDHAKDVDAMSALHETLMTKLQSRCLLSKDLAPIHDSIISILDLAVLYTDSQTRHVQKRNGEPSLIPKPDQYRRRRRSAAQSRMQVAEESETSSSSEEDEDYDADTETPSSRDEPYEERLQKIQEQFGQLLHFTIAGLRGVSRAGGEMAWEMLAERLEWGVQPSSRRVIGSWLA